MSQSASDVRDRIIRIVGDSAFGTGFFIQPGICVTCHHVISGMERISVQHGNASYDARWIRELSDMEQDIAMLRVENCGTRPLLCGPGAMPDLTVTGIGFSVGDVKNLPEGTQFRGQLASLRTEFTFPAERVSGRSEWNVKPDVRVEGFQLDNQYVLERGFSGSPVCYPSDWSVLGMLSAARPGTSRGFVIPIQTILGLLPREPRVASPSANQDTNTTLDDGNRFFNAREYAKAIQYYDAILRDPNYLNALYNKGLALHHLEEYDEAISCFTEVLSELPNSSVCLGARAASYWYSGQYANAVADYSKEIELDPNSFPAFNGRGFVYVEMGEYKRALNDLDRALNLTADRIGLAYSHNAHAYALGALGQYEQALAEFSTSIGLSPGNAWVYYNRALTYDRMGRIAEAKVDFAQALKMRDPPLNFLKHAKAQSRLQELGEHGSQNLASRV